MSLNFVGTFDRDALVRAADSIAELVAAPEVGVTWEHDSALPGMTVGGLTRHLVSQPECALEFLSIPPRPQAPTLSLSELYRRTDWFEASAEAPENTSIRDDFNAMAGGGQAEAVAILRRAHADLPTVIATAGPTTYVPWQDCFLQTNDFLVVRLMEIVVHADDLADSVGRPTPAFADDIVHPVVALLAMLSAQRHGAAATVRALARSERAGAAVSAFQG